MRFTKIACSASAVNMPCDSKPNDGFVASRSVPPANTSTLRSHSAAPPNYNTSSCRVCTRGWVTRRRQTSSGRGAGALGADDGAYRQCDDAGPAQAVREQAGRSAADPPPIPGIAPAFNSMRCIDRPLGYPRHWRQLQSVSQPPNAVSTTRVSTTSFI